MAVHGQLYVVSPRNILKHCQLRIQNRYLDDSPFPTIANPLSGNMPETAAESGQEAEQGGNSDGVPRSEHVSPDGAEAPTFAPNVVTEPQFEVLPRVLGHLRYMGWAQKHQDCVSSRAHLSALMVHATLITLADYLDLPGLHALASIRLNSHIDTLACGLTPAIASDLSTLAQYLYENTMEKTGTGSQGSSRKFIAEFIASHFSAFEGEGFNEIMKKGGDLVVDVFAQIKQKMAEKNNIGKKGDKTHLKRKSRGQTQPDTPRKSRKSGPK